MGGFDDDDLHDYENEDLGFDEDALNDDEYDQLYDALPKLKALAKNHQVDEKTLKEILWNNYFSIDDSFEEVKQNYKREYGEYVRAVPDGGPSWILTIRTANVETGAAGTATQRAHGPARAQERGQRRLVWSSREGQGDAETGEGEKVPAGSGRPGAEFCSRERRTERPRDSELGGNRAPKKAAANFEKPGPDDRKVESLTEKVAKIKIKEPKPAASKPKQKIDIDAELAKKNSKPNLSFVVIGHVDSGKSTLIGRLLYDLGIVDSKTLHKLTKESGAMGKSSFSLAWIMDQTQEERSRGVTVDICQTQIETPRQKFTIIDSPGHKDYVPQMINGVSQADLAVMNIDANSFESGFSNQGQTKEHLTIAKSLGVERCVVTVNKLDVAQWSQTVYDAICSQIRQFLVDELAYDAANLVFVPTSGFLGDNVVRPSKNLAWYTGPTLMQVLEQENRAISHVVDKKSPFVMVISDIQEPSKNDELVVSGRINSGIIQPGESVSISPSQEVGEVASISITASSVGSSVIKHDLQKLAQEGEFVELKLKKLASRENVKVGDVVTLSSNVLQPVKKFKCELNLFNIERPLLVGTPFVLFKNGISVPSRLSEIESIVTKDGRSKKRRHLSSNNTAVVVVELLERELPLVTIAQDRKLGRVVVRKDGLSIGAGKILELVA
ncbi:hypothetical protein KL920_003564 [Ogataea angusta]|nr:hypothetical protein KL920_003564 [Ogataea angusta]